MAVIDPYRVVVIAIIFIMWTIIAFDHVFNPSSWTKIFFDLLTQGKVILREINSFSLCLIFYLL